MATLLESIAYSGFVNRMAVSINLIVKIDLNWNSFASNTLLFSCYF